MKKFDYLVLQSELDTKPIPQKLNTLGSEGWELVSVIENHGYPRFYFKREVSPSPADPAPEQPVSVPIQKTKPTSKRSKA